MTFGQAPQNSRGGLMLPLEGNRWMATIGGRHGDVPPGDAEGFLTYAKALRTPTIYNAIKVYGVISSDLTSSTAGSCPSVTQSAASIPSTAKA